MKKLLSNPVIQGNTAVFQWEGPKAPQLVGDFNGWNFNQPITLSAAGKNRWRHEMQLPLNAYIEYAYFINGKRVMDPDNPQSVSNGFDTKNNFFYLPPLQATRLIKKSARTPQGTIKRYKLAGRMLLGGEEHALELFQRQVTLYQPPVSEPVPLLVVFDGEDYLRRVRLPVILDNMINQKRIRPLALAMVANGGKNRILEYACSDVTLGFLRDSLIPLARKELKLVNIDNIPGTYGVLGASMGGLMAFYCGLRLPEIFGNVLSQSGSLYHGFVVDTLLSQGIGMETRIWMDVGRFEFLLNINRQVHATLVEKGYSVTYQEYNAGHNYTAWRDDLISGLEIMFGL